MDGGGKPLRLQMPEIAAWIDDLRAAFGKDEIDKQIRRGLAGEPVFYACEGGHEIGCRPPRREIALTADEFLALGKAAKRWEEFEASRWPKDSSSSDVPSSDAGG